MNANSLVNNLSDICGEHLPFYFDTWIVGGQSPLPTYLAALSIKLLGYSVFSYRLPMLIVSIAGLLAFYGLIRELTDNQTIIISSLIFCAFSPWHLFNSSWIIDCAFMSHFLVIGIFFLILAIKKTKNFFWLILSMLFFSFTFYSYNSAILFTPVFLLAIYVLLLKNRKVSFWFAVKSFFILLIFSLPFILYGLVNIGIMDDMQFLGLSISKMDYYTRSNEMTLLNDLPWKEKLIRKICDIAVHCAFLCYPDAPGNTALLLNKFQYTNFVGGLFLLFGVTSLLKHNDNNQQDLRRIVIATLIAMLFYVFSVYSYNLSVYYRYFIYNYLLFIPMGYGFYILTKKLKSKRIIATLCGFLVISISLFGFQFSQYEKELRTDIRDHSYADGAFKCFDRINELGIDRYRIVESHNYFMVDYLFAYYKDDGRFCDFQDAMMYAYGVSDSNNLTTDDSIEMIDLTKTDPLEDECYIFLSGYLDQYSISDEYTLEQYGAYTLAYRMK